MKRYKYMIIRIALLFLMACGIYLVIQQKENLNVDEVLNYELANGENGWNLEIEDGRTYTDGNPFLKR